MEIISCVNQKGGVGKSTSVINIAMGLSNLGYKTLLIDLDQQSHLAKILGVATKELEYTTWELFQQHIEHKTVNIEKFLVRVKSDNLFLIPSRINLARADLILPTVIGSEHVLKNILHKISDFDFIFLDCPPSLGKLVINALVASDQIIIPIKCEYLPLEGTADLLNTVEQVKEVNNNLNILGILANNVKINRNMDRAIIEDIKNNFPGLLFDTVITENVKISEAQAMHESIYSYAPESNGAEDFKNLCIEIIERLNKYREV